MNIQAEFSSKKTPFVSLKICLKNRSTFDITAKRLCVFKTHSVQHLMATYSCEFVPCPLKILLALSSFLSTELYSIHTCLNRVISTYDHLRTWSRFLRTSSNLKDNTQQLVPLQHTKLFPVIKIGNWMQSTITVLARTITVPYCYYAQYVVWITSTYPSLKISLAVCKL